MSKKDCYYRYSQRYRDAKRWRNHLGRMEDPTVGILLLISK
jgi:hypothetical protein